MDGIFEYIRADMPTVLDDKSEHCVPFVLEQIKRHRQAHAHREDGCPPFFVGLNGIQGAGKTTLVKSLVHTLNDAPHNLHAIEFSIDDLYLSHDEQVELAASCPDNPLIQHRGQPSTHSVEIGVDLFAAILRKDKDIKVPAYDKSCFAGAGDRMPQHEWQILNREGEQTVEVVIFEGWCVGFRALSIEEVIHKWKAARALFLEGGHAYRGRLGRSELKHVLFVNDKLKAYDALTSKLGTFIHIDAKDTQYVYGWRQQQETALRAAKGTGMTDQEVVAFIDGYYPAYELYTSALRKGLWKERGRHLRLVVDQDRRVREVVRM